MSMSKNKKYERVRRERKRGQIERGSDSKVSFTIINLKLPNFALKYLFHRFGWAQNLFGPVTN